MHCSGSGGKEDVVGHPVVGQCWEGFVIENTLSVAPDDTEASFYRASGGAEIDLILLLPGRKPWAIEIKRSLDPKPARGFHNACADVKPEAKYVVYPGDEKYSISRSIVAISAADLAREVVEETSNS